jgi:hypothetical protein
MNSLRFVGSAYAGDARYPMTLTQSDPELIRLASVSFG